MGNRIGIRREDKNEWERRVPLIPSDVAKLVSKGIDVSVEKSSQRVFGDDEYKTSKAVLVDSVRDTDIVLGIKEMPASYFKHAGAYIYFSHTIKGQSYNMKMLAELVNKKCTLIDYELVTDENGKRLIFFGRFAGVAGMVGTFWTLGRRLKYLGYTTPFDKIEPAHKYLDIDGAKQAVAKMGKAIAKGGLPLDLTPFVIGFTGYGHVSKGAQEIFDVIPHIQVEPADLAKFVAANKGLNDKLIKVIYKEKDLVNPINKNDSFELQDYYDYPEKYESAFEPHLSNLSVIVNCIYWNKKYPKLADADQLRKLFSSSARPKLLAVGDITCDVDGSLACTVRDTDSGDPVYVYDPVTRNGPSGFEGPGLSVMAVGNLPTEVPKEASEAFSKVLTQCIPKLAEMNLKDELANINLSGPMGRAIILWKGEFTPNYKYMSKFLQ